MFENNSRTIYEDGLYFFEEDVVYDDHIFSGDQEIKVKFDYFQSGFGVLFCLKAGAPLASQNYYYFLRLGYREISLFFINGDYYERVGQYPFIIEAPHENLELSISLENGKLSTRINSIFVGSTRLDVVFSNYSLGYYSQRGNTLKEIVIQGKVPNFWYFELDKTQGGRISFTKDNVYLKSNGVKLEFLQENIFLEAGEYFLRYEQDGDIEAIVYSSESQYVHDYDKNILKNGTFALSKDTSIVLKFSGTYGTIRNIQITNNVNSAYVSTKNQSAHQPSSEITLSTEEIYRLRCLFEFVEKEENAVLLKGQFNNYPFPELVPGIYELIVEKQKIKVMANGKTYFEDYYTGSLITLFLNVRLYILSFVITHFDGKETDWFKQQEFIEYVTHGIDTPIIVTNSDDYPYELSSSFRVVDGLYVFTNVEREYFLPSVCCKLRRPVKNIKRVYGIPKHLTLDKSLIYVGKNEYPDDLTSYAPYYEQLSYTFDEKYNQIVIHDALDYQEIVIDYLKADSYCINFIPAMFAYEVKITENNYKVFYEKKDQTHLVTPLVKQDNNYLVLKK